MVDKKVEDIFKKYGKKLEQEVSQDLDAYSNFSKDYTTFKAEMAPELNRF